MIINYNLWLCSYTFSESCKSLFYKCLLSVCHLLNATFSHIDNNSFCFIQIIINCNFIFWICCNSILVSVYNCRIVSRSLSREISVSVLFVLLNKFSSRSRNDVVLLTVISHNNIYSVYFSFFLPLLFKKPRARLLRLMQIRFRRLWSFSNW